MVRYLDIEEQASRTLEDYYGYLEDNIDPNDDDSLWASAGEFRKLANNEDILLDMIEAGLKDALTFQSSTFNSAQVFELPSPDIPRCSARFAIWNPPSANHYYEAYWYGYNLTHNHNFSFLTQTVLGPGYKTRICSVDKNESRIFGEKVRLRSIEDLTLSPNRVLLYESDTDIHIQFPPKEMSLTLNFIVLKPDIGQYVFDINDCVVLHQISGPENMCGKLISVACSIGDELLLAMVKDLAKTHESDNVRIYACVALLRYGYISVDEVKSLLGPNRYRFVQSKRLQAILRSVEFEV